MVVQVCVSIINTKIKNIFKRRDNNTSTCLLNVSYKRYKLNSYRVIKFELKLISIAIGI